MVTSIIIGILFVGALIYIGKLIYAMFKDENACAKGCGSCSVDVKKI